MKKYISSHPKILGGVPVIKGTRVPVSQILFLLKNGSTLFEIHDMYRHISIETLQKVIEEINHKLPAITRHDEAILQA